MAFEINKSARLALGLGLSVVSGGLAAWLTSHQLGKAIAPAEPVEIPVYHPPPESPLAGEPLAAIPPAAAPSGDGEPGIPGIEDGGEPDGVASVDTGDGFTRKPGLSDFQSIEARNIFNSAVVGLPQTPTGELADGGAAGDAGAGRLPALCIHVRHTLDAQPQAYSWALISRDEQGSDQEIFRIGDPVFEEGSKLVRVGIKEVEILRRDDSRIIFEIGAPCEAGSSAPSVPLASNEPIPEGGVGDGIQQTGENQFVIPAAEIDAAMSNLEQLAKDARVVPHYQNGEIVGFKVFRIKAGSVYSKLGLKNGDVIERINGEAINSPERALALYQTLRSEKGFQLDLRRRNQPMTLSYEVR